MKNRVSLTTLLFIIALIFYGCNLPVAEEATPAAAAAAPTDTAAPSLPTETQPPLATAIQHTTIPIDLPAERSNHAGDQKSVESAKNQEAGGGDRFTFGFYERPFNANTMDTYFPYLDIIDTFTYQDDTWIFATITLQGGDANNSLPGKYALELDMDVDGRGDFLVLDSAPHSTDWTTDGVQVWQDTNKDVGGKAPFSADDNPAPGNGFDLMLFDSGTGNDADAAWARISPADPNTVQLAVKRSLLTGSNRYLAGMWAGTDSLNPALFDFNDHMTHEQAGAALRGFELYYPIKELAELDASCRVAIGFAPTGYEPGLCPELSPIQPTSPPPPPPKPTEPKCPPLQCTYGQYPYPDCRCVIG